MSETSVGTEAGAGPDRRRVFVIHGRNDLARRALFEFLRSAGLQPIEWSEAIAMTGEGSPYIGNVLDSAFQNAQAIVVLQTPDDVAYLHSSLTHEGDPETDPQMQPRPNVLFEAGMAMGRDPMRTIIVELGRVKHFSDIHGRHVVRLDNTIAMRQQLLTRLETAGCLVSRDGTDWHEAGNLTPPPPPGGGLPMGRRLPSTVSRSTPRLDARYISNSGSRMDQIDIVNHGPGDVLDLDLDEDMKASFPHAADDLPVPRLPAGRHVRMFHLLGRHSFGDRGASYFNLKVHGRTEDGVEFSEEIFVSQD